MIAGARETSSKNHFPIGFFNPAEPHTVYLSEWEAVPAWQLTAVKGTLFATYTRQLPQISSDILDEGVVLLFARGYDFEAVSRGEEKPVGLPFYMTLSNESMPQPFAWSYEAKKGKVQVALSMQEALERGFQSARNDIRLRYFVLPSQFLQEHKLTPMAARNLSYNQLVTLLNTTP